MKSATVLLLAFFLASCNFRQELSSKDQATYKTFIESTEFIANSRQLQRNAAQFASGAGLELPENLGSRKVDTSGPTERVKCLKDQRDKRVPAVEGVGFCQKSVPM